MFSLISFCLFQIGTGFKDEDLEQHYKFLKVKWPSMTGLVKNHSSAGSDVVFEDFNLAQLALFEVSGANIYFTHFTCSGSIEGQTKMPSLGW